MAAFSFGSMAGQQSASPVSRTVEGMVLDRGGHPVPGAVVLMEDLKSLQVRSYLVQQDGKYHFHGLSSDANYELRAHFNGAASGPKTVTVFNSGHTIVVNLKLSVKAPKTPPRAAVLQRNSPAWRANYRQTTPWLETTHWTPPARLLGILRDPF